MQIRADRCELYGTIVGTIIQCHVTTVGTIAGTLFPVAAGSQYGTNRPLEDLARDLR